MRRSTFVNMHNLGIRTTWSIPQAMPEAPSKWSQQEKTTSWNTRTGPFNITSQVSQRPVSGLCREGCFDGKDLCLSTIFRLDHLCPGAFLDPAIARLAFASILSRWSLFTGNAASGRCSFGAFCPVWSFLFGWIVQSVPPNPWSWQLPRPRSGVVYLFLNIVSGWSHWLLLFPPVHQTRWLINTSGCGYLEQTWHLDCQLVSSLRWLLSTVSGLPKFDPNCRWKYNFRGLSSGVHELIVPDLGTDCKEWSCCYSARRLGRFTFWLFLLLVFLWLFLFLVFLVLIFLCPFARVLFRLFVHITVVAFNGLVVRLIG